MCDKREEVRKDIAELQMLLAQATRQKSKDLLSIEIRKLESQLIALNETSSKKLDPMEVEPSTTQVHKCIQIKLNNYGWDQSNKFLKLYVTVPKVQTIPAESVHCTFTNKSVELVVKNLENKDYTFNIKNLLYNVDPEKSSWKVKTDMIAIMVAKEKEQNWSHVTELEKKAAESKTLLPDKMDDTKDPTENLMNMMKKLYETGDDEMKKTIAKAWTESQRKKESEF